MIGPDPWSPTQRIEALTRQVMRLNEQIRDLRDINQALQTTNSRLTRDYNEAEHKLKAWQKKWNREFPPIKVPKPLKPIPPFETTQAYKSLWVAARREHVWLLRAEGLTYKEIGEHLSISRGRAQQLHATFMRRARWATRKTKWYNTNA